MVWAAPATGATPTTGPAVVEEDTEGRGEPSGELGEGAGIRTEGINGVELEVRLIMICRSNL